MPRRSPAPAASAAGVRRRHRTGSAQRLDIALALSDPDPLASLDRGEHLGQPIEHAAHALDARRAIGPALEELLAGPAHHLEQQLPLLVDVAVDALGRAAPVRRLVEEIGESPADGRRDAIRLASGLAVQDHALAPVVDREARGAVVVAWALRHR